jgi:hypothetical protein
VTNVDYDMMNTTIKTMKNKISRTIWNRDIFVNQLKTTLDEILQSNKYLKINEMERTIIQNTFSVMIEQNWSDHNEKKHPALQYLLEHLLEESKSRHESS